ncbi:hypothetical protein [Clostridium phoceensis]|uniref:hypothetical protein n=1 Tax=Clostridium phoceensis TaxID=1650661 RepID=UPI00067EC22B|nr:hypothetical protein [Clostridium phoceensis]
MDNLIIILFSMYFCYRSFRDFAGDDEAIRKEYRELPGRKKWQKNKAILEMIIGVGTIIFVLCQREKIATIVIGIAVLFAFVLSIINNKKYIRQARKEDKP